MSQILINKISWKQAQDLMFKDNSQQIFIDLRSPLEFEKGSIPGSLNLCLLNNNERQEIGLIYKQEGKEKALQAGLELFSYKAQAFLNKIIALSPQNKTLVLYCWRGGMRSFLVTLWLQKLGFICLQIEGGYTSYRKYVLKNLERLSSHRLLILHGRTGSGKTELIQDLLTRDQAVIDLEGLACHRGSAFGSLAQKNKTPSQQNFENKLSAAYYKIKKSPIILMEIETMIGPICLPKQLRTAILSAPMIHIERDYQHRVNALTKIYTKNWNPESTLLFNEKILLLKRYLSKENYESIISSVKQRDFSKAINILLKFRYDKTYDKSLQRKSPQFIANFNISYELDKTKNYIVSYLKQGKP